MESEVSSRLALEAELRTSLQASAFMLHYQPQVDGSGRIVGAEALLRWTSPSRGPVGPAEFIPVAEGAGLTGRLGRWALREACTQLGQWSHMPHTARLTVAVNVSVHQLREPGFVSDVLQVLGECGVNLARLKLELTESVLIEDVDETIDKMLALKHAGISFALDDFGTGYSSLSYLKRLPLDQLKIDRAFVRDILTNPNDAAIARSIVALSKSLGLGTIAEGVETVEQQRFLAEIGCTFCQGYLFGKPVEAAEFALSMRAQADALSFPG